MKTRKLFMMLFLLCMVGTSAKAVTPQWVSDLLTNNKGVIDSIRVYDPDPADPHYTTYIVYYNQPLQHAVPGSPRFHMRALLTVDNTEDATKAVNHVYCSGYELSEAFLQRPDSMFSNTINWSTEIAHRYEANFIQIEHRYFSYSAPDLCWEQLDYCKAEEAAEDFHALFDALKKVLKGKWVMSGVSKGGITTLLQHTFFPDDMDVYVPYSAPFFESDREKGMQKYWYENGWSKEFRDMYMAVRQNGIRRSDTIFPIYEKMNGGDNTEATRNILYGLYLAAVTQYGHNDHAYNDTASIRKQMYKNQEVLNRKRLEYGDTVYAFMLSKDAFSLDSLPRWIDTLRAHPNSTVPVQRSLVRRHYRPFGVKQNEWFDSKESTGQAYEYQSKCELGYYDARFDLLFDDAADAEKWQKFWSETYGCLRDVYSPLFSKLAFSRALYDRVMEATKNAQKPIVFIYGEDDAWTGAAVKDEFVNGTNVRKFILSAQNHLASYTGGTDPDKCKQILQQLDGTLGSLPTDIRGVESVKQESDRYYNMMGQQVDKNTRGLIILNGRKYVNK
jgi:hypothetical protein